MKKQIAVLFLFVTTVLLGQVYWSPGPSPQTLVAVLSWQLTTNWYPCTYSYVPPVPADQAPKREFSQTGVIHSNLVATLEWKGETHKVTLESHSVDTIFRTYTLEIKPKHETAEGGRAY